jgi:alpha-glucosidase
MDFLFGNLTTLDAAVFKKQVDAAQTQLSGQTPVFFFSSHDHPRQWSTFGDGSHNDQIAKLIAALTLTQRGCVLLYYGEELGMATMPASELKAVPTGPKRPRADERDGERTPMQWDAGVNAGFSKGSPWLPVESGYQHYNVESEKEDSASIYAWYAKLLKLRHDNPAFRDGSYVPLDSGNPDVFVFARKAGANNVALVVLNTSPQEQQVRLNGTPKRWPAFRNVLMASPPASTPPSESFTIAPYGVLIAGTIVAQALPPAAF